jgi:hypothetical protein
MLSVKGGKTRTRFSADTLFWAGWMVSFDEETILFLAA